MGRKKKEPTKVIRVPVRHDEKIRKFVLQLDHDDRGIMPADKLDKVNWSRVADYESDENTVVLYDRKQNRIGEYAFGRFGQLEFDMYVLNWHKRNINRKITG